MKTKSIKTEKNTLLKFSVITLFPEMISIMLNEGVVSRGIKKNLIQISPVDLRTYGTGVRKNVDGRPAGGGDGMVIRADVTEKAILAHQTPNSYIIHLSPSGQKFDHLIAKELAQKSHIILLCGRYAGFDDRVVRQYAHLNLSLGDFVMSGGELPAMCVIDAVSRFVPGVLGNEKSASQDSFENGLLEAPQYTKPLCFHGMHIPEVLLSGHHANIQSYQRQEQIRCTREHRPDLLLKKENTLALEEKKW